MVPPDGVLSIAVGSLRSLGLALLAFSPRNRTLSHVANVEGVSQHQFLATIPGKDLLYGTSLNYEASDGPPTLVSWKILRDQERVVSGLEVINRVNITSTSGCITIPPPYTHVYSTGGFTGEVHEINPASGGFERKVQELAYISEKELEIADKGPTALRTGSHGIEISSSGYAFVSIMGTDSIEMFKRDIKTGILTHLSTNINARIDVQDSERHTTVHPNGKILYGVTEHSNRVDVYDILESAGILRLRSSHDIVPPSIPTAGKPYRGTTAFLIPSTNHNENPTALIASTRGPDEKIQGWISIFRLNQSGHITSAQSGTEDPANIIRFKTPTSGGLGNDMAVRTKGEGEGTWILLSDHDEEASAGRSPSVRVLEWGGWNSGDPRIRIVAQWPTSFPPASNGPDLRGASRPVWLD